MVSLIDEKSKTLNSLSRIYIKLLRRHHPINIKADALNFSTRPQSVALRALALETVERVSAILTLRAVI